MFIDTAKVKLQAGKGGDGAVSFRREIYIPKGGPDGGDGGKGGSIIFRADKDTDTLLNFRYNPELKAEDGKNGSGTRSAGRSGKDNIVEVPIGTVVYRLPEKTLLADLTKHGEQAVIARGGSGGFGNAHFKSSTRQAPIIAEVGEPGEAFEAQLELKLLADVGLVGLPNAGKSTFLSVVSSARPEIANYPFTTLTPQLGVATIDGHDLLIADIPGLIEGAAAGKGLGHAFLRHVERTALLLHLVDVYNDDAGQAYRTIRHELEQYADLASRPELVVLTKCEGLDLELIELQKQAILAQNPQAQIFAISATAHQGLEELLRATFALAAKARSVHAAVSAHIDSAQDGTDPASSTNSADSANLVDSTNSANNSANLPLITLPPTAYAETWQVEHTPEGKFVVTGAKIEKFARRTDFNNYASVNRLRDILKKMGIRAELTNQGAVADSIISIADKEFTLVEDY